MSIFFERLNGTGKSGRVNLINLQDKLPELYSEMLASQNRDMADWDSLHIDENKLASFYARVSPIMMNECLSANDNLTFFRELRQCSYAEKCKYTYGYISLFNALCASLQRFPTMNEYWKFWEQKNHSAIAEELNDQLAYSAITQKMQNAGESYDKCKQQFMNGLQLRAKRFYCAAIREIDTMLTVAQDIPGEYEGYQVFMHPLIDSVCKYDAIVLTPEKEAVALAICLESPMSSRNIERKADQIPKYFKPLVTRAVGFDISMKTYDKGITIASRQEKENLRLAMSGDRYMVRSMNQLYTWKNSVTV